MRLLVNVVQEISYSVEEDIEIDTNDYPDLKNKTLEEIQMVGDFLGMENQKGDPIRYTHNLNDGDPLGEHEHPTEDCDYSDIMISHIRKRS